MVFTVISTQALVTVYAVGTCDSPHNALNEVSHWHEDGVEAKLRVLRYIGGRFQQFGLSMPTFS